MADGLRIHSRIEKDIIPFLIRNYLWDEDNNEPNKAMKLICWVEKIKDIQESTYDKPIYHWYFTKIGKENICKLINNIY